MAIADTAQVTSKTDAKKMNSSSGSRREPQPLSEKEIDMDALRMALRGGQRENSSRDCASREMLSLGLMKMRPSQRASAVLGLQRTQGNRYVSRMAAPAAQVRAQAKLRIGQPDDVYEHEADRVAEQVMRMPEPKGLLSQSVHTSVPRITPMIQGKAEPDLEEEGIKTRDFIDYSPQKVQRKDILDKNERKDEDEVRLQEIHSNPQNVSVSGLSVPSALESRIDSLEGRGSPLSESARSFFEPRFGRDFSQVRIHKSSEAAEAARSINALAFTVKRNIFFADGQYSLDTPAGGRLLAHELTHVMQQSGGSGNRIRKKDEGTSDTKLSWWERKKKGMIEDALAYAGVPKDQVAGLINKAGSAIMQIIQEPGRFVNTLIKAVGQGFRRFKDNIGKHLKAGLMGWLFGEIASAGIEIPKDPFSIKSILSLILQVLGITKMAIRKKLVDMIGERNVGRIEKAWQVLSTLMSEGIGGLWEMLKDYLGNLKEILMEEVKSWLITQIITRAVMMVLSMFNPVSGLITIIKTIYSVIKFLIEQAGKIKALFQAIVGSVVELAMGSAEKAANKIEEALARLIPIAIGFMASLLGIKNMANNIRNIIKRIQSNVSKAIDKIIAKVAGGAGKLFGKGAREKGTTTDVVGAAKARDKRRTIDVVEDVKAKIAVRSKRTFGSFDEAQDMINNVFKQFRNRGLKSLRLKKPQTEAKGIKFDVIAEASPGKDVGDINIAGKVGEPGCDLHVGPYKEVKKANRDKKNEGFYQAHHAPANDVNNRYGIEKEEGIAINLPAVFHLMTGSYGKTIDPGRSFYTLLMQEVRDLKSAILAGGPYTTSEVNKALQELKRQNKDLWKKKGISGYESFKNIKKLKG